MEALRAIYTALQVQYGQVEDKLRAVYTPFQPIIGYREPDQLKEQEALLSKTNHEIIELDNEEEEAAAKVKDEWVTRGSHFVNSILWFAKRSGYRACSITDEIYAKQNHYRLTTPVKVDWNHFDHNILSKVRPYDTCFPDTDPPSFGHKAIILMRGEGLDSSRGFYFYEKFDEITIRYARRMWNSAIRNARNIFGLSDHQSKVDLFLNPNKFHAKVDRAKHKIVNKMLEVPALTEIIPEHTASAARSYSVEKRQQVKCDDEQNNNDHMLGTDTILLDHDEYNKNALSEIKFTFANVLGRITLQEETFEDALVIYETRDYSEEKSGFDRSAVLEHKHDVHLRHFQQVPKCDMEFVLPEDAQKVYMRPIDRVFLGMSIVGGTGLVSGVYWTGLALTHAGIVAATALGMYSVRIFNRYRLSKFYYRSAMAQYMSSNATSRDDNVIHIVTREAQNHDFVALACVMSAAWEIKRDAGALKGVFDSLRGHTQKGSPAKEEAIELEHIKTLASNIFAKAEATKHKEGLREHDFQNAIHWLVRMNVIELCSEDSSTVIVKCSDDILLAKEELIGLAFDVGRTLEALNMNALKDIETVEDLVSPVISLRK